MAAEEKKRQDELKRIERERAEGRSEPSVEGGAAASGLPWAATALWGAAVESGRAGGPSVLTPVC